MSLRAGRNFDDGFFQVLINAGIENMTTLRDLQAGLAQALKEIKDRNETIEELKAMIEDRDKNVDDLQREVSMLKAVLENPTQDTSISPHHNKRIAISAAPAAIIKKFSSVKKPDAYV